MVRVGSIPIYTLGLFDKVYIYELEVIIMTNYSKDELMDKMDELKEMLGADELLLNLAKAMSSDELFDNLGYIDRMNDTGLFA